MLPYLNSTVGLQGMHIFTKLDLIKMYYQIPVKESDISKNDITTHLGLFKFIKMLFGLRNAAQSFQRLIDEVLRG